jgi:hypothetical protein
VLKIRGSICQPWFFPPPNDSTRVCDPWESKNFFGIMPKNIPDSMCLHCLPDCSSTFYVPTINQVPLESCDASNFGVSKFCQLNLISHQPMLEAVTSQIIKEYQNVDNGYYRTHKTPKYINTMDNSIRNYGFNIFNKSPITYNAFDRDIAMVEIIYQKPTLVQIESQLIMTWIDYFSSVGGLMGLVLGISFVSSFELIWLCFRIASKKLNYTKWIA